MNALDEELEKWRRERTLLERELGALEAHRLKHDPTLLRKRLEALESKNAALTREAESLEQLAAQARARLPKARVIEWLPVGMMYVLALMCTGVMLAAIRGF
jgi:chromosome segregation ATPase